MKSPANARHAPYLTIAQMGLFPPFLHGGRVDYVSWTFARRYNRWLAAGVLAIVGLNVLQVAALEAAADRRSLLAALTVLFGLLLFLYNHARRWLLNHSDVYFTFSLQLARAIGAVTVVAVLQATLGVLGHGSPLTLWLLYIPAVAVASEHLYHNWPEILIIGLILVVTVGLQFGVPLASGELAPTPEGLVQALTRSLVMLGGVAGYQFLVRNIQKRAVHFHEERRFSSGLAQTLEHPDHPERLWRFSLETCLRRLHARHGSVWVRYPASGAVQLAAVLRRATLDDGSAFEDVTDASRPAADAGVQAAALIEAVTARQCALAWTTSESSIAVELDGRGPALFARSDSPFVYQIAAPIRDRGGTGEIIGVLNINYGPGKLDQLIQSNRLLRRLGQKARIWLVNWERDLLEHMSHQLSGPWEHAYMVQTVERTMGRLSDVIAAPSNTEMASRAADSLAETFQTTAHAWLYHETTGGFCLATPSEGLGAGRETYNWTAWLEPAVAATQPYDTRLPDALFGRAAERCPRLLLFCVEGRRGPLAVFGLEVLHAEALAGYIQSTIGSFLAQVVHAIDNRSLLLHQTARNEALQAITLKALKAGTLEDFCDAAWSTFRESLPGALAHVGVVRSGEIEFPTRFHRAHSSIPLAPVDHAEATILHEAIACGQPVLKPIVAEGERPLGSNWPDARSALVVPLRTSDDQTRALLILHDTEHPNRFNARNQDDLVAMASVLGLAVHHLIKTARFQLIASNEDIRTMMLRSISLRPNIDDALRLFADALREHLYAEQPVKFVAIWKARTRRGGGYDLCARSVADATETYDPDVETALERLRAEPLADTEAIPFVVAGRAVPCVFVLPLQVEGVTLGGLAIGVAQSPQHIAVTFRRSLQQTALDLAASWRQRRLFEDTVVQREMQTIRRKTHDELGGLARNAHMGWRRFCDRFPTLTPAELNQGIETVAPGLDRVIRLTRVAIRKTLNHKDFALLHSGGLPGAMRDVVDISNTLMQGERSVDLAVDAAVADSLTDAETEALFSIFESGLDNALKAPGVTHVSVALRCQAAGGIAFALDDDGPGFNAIMVMEQPQHFGLRSMRETAETIGWSFAVESRRPGGGTQLRLWRERSCEASKEGRS